MTHIVMSFSFYSYSVSLISKHVTMAVNIVIAVNIISVRGTVVCVFLVLC